MLWSLALLGCESTEKDTAIVEFNQGPEISVLLPEQRLVSGLDLQLQAVITDADGVSSATIYHRPLGDAYWDSTQMTQVSGDNWEAILPLMDPGLEFYVKAQDGADPSVSALFPTSGPSNPEILSIYPSSLPLPFFEDFEMDAGQLTLRDLDWWTPSDGRNTFAWGLNTSHVYDGGYAVYHPRGSEGIEELNDWLISPPLDFSTESQIMVGWWEYGLSVANTQEHSLWISTGSRLPEDGDFQLVEILEPAQGPLWSRHSFVDLSEFAGEPLVYVAWKWTGSNADEWFVDGISVRPLAPDFALQTLRDNPNDPNGVLRPGQSANISLLLENLTGGTAETCSTEVTFQEGVLQSSYVISDWAIADHEMLRQDLLIELDAELNPNRNIPMHVLVTCGDDQWEFQESILVGYPSIATVTIDVLESTQFIANIGVGEPLAALWMDALTSGILEPGVHTFELDITDQYMYLPAQAGEHRWFAQFNASSDVNIQSLNIVYGEEMVSADVPRLALADFETTLEIPPPPNFYVLSTTPVSVQPGDSDIPIAISVYNIGNPTQGPVMASIESNHPMATVLNLNGLNPNGQNSIMVDLDSWTSNEMHSISGFTLSVSEQHTTSLPVDLMLILEDEVESWMVPFTVDVPYPRLGVIAIQVLDGDNGILDPNETADLEVTIANTGDSNATGVVSAQLSLLSSSSATANVINSNPSFGFMNAGAVKDENDFTVEVLSGSQGDTLNFQLDMMDSVRNYSDTFQVVLGETPWISLSAIQDSATDSLDALSMDLLSAQYRVTNGIVELRIESSTMIDPGTAFIEAWGNSGGADYAYFRWVLQSGIATMQGYNGGVGFQNIGTMTATFEDDYHVIWSFDSADLGLALTQFNIGLASGWCGPPVYYCDQYPNNWGYPYVSFSTGNWFQVSWND